MISDFDAQPSRTTIDNRSLLSSDYFNHFNEIIMLFGLLPDMPEMLEEIEAWQFRSYVEYFSQSGLDFAPLAVKAYARLPKAVRQTFDDTVLEMRRTIEEARSELRLASAREEPGLLSNLVSLFVQRLQDLVDRGSALARGCSI